MLNFFNSPICQNGPFSTSSRTLDKPRRCPQNDIQAGQIPIGPHLETGCSANRIMVIASQITAERHWHNLHYCNGPQHIPEQPNHGGPLATSVAVVGLCAWLLLVKSQLSDIDIICIIVTVIYISMEFHTYIWSDIYKVQQTKQRKTNQFLLSRT